MSWATPCQSTAKLHFLLDFTLTSNLKILIISEEISNILMPVPSNMFWILFASKVKSHLCMYLSISCCWNLKISWYFGTIVINEVEFGATAFTIKDHMFPIKLQIIRIMCPIRGVKLPPLPTTYFNQVESWNPIFSLTPILFPHLGFPAQRSALLQLLSPPLQIFPQHLPSLFNSIFSS